MTPEEKRAWAISQLQACAERLGHLPKKDDFDQVTMGRIKAFLGPWPRALEAAGLKEPRPQKKQKKRSKTT